MLRKNEAAYNQNLACEGAAWQISICKGVYSDLRQLLVMETLIIEKPV